MTCCVPCVWRDWHCCGAPLLQLLRDAPTAAAAQCQRHTRAARQSCTPAAARVVPTTRHATAKAPLWSRLWVGRCRGTLPRPPSHASAGVGGSSSAGASSPAGASSWAAAGSSSGTAAAAAAAAGGGIGEGGAAAGGGGIFRLGSAGGAAARGFGWSAWSGRALDGDFPCAGVRSAGPGCRGVYNTPGWPFLRLPVLASRLA
jgi:hypothetical protein